MNALWLVTALSLAATVMNIHHLRACFVLWLGTSATWAMVDARAVIYAHSFLHFVYLGLAIYGLHRWKHEARGEAP
jgi:hypothetical protein